MKKISKLIVVAAAAGSLSLLGTSCTPTQRGAAAGAGVGALGGALIGGRDGGDAGRGALTGAAVGGLGGALIGDANDNRGRRY